MRELTLPSLAESVVEGEILAWLIEEGQSFNEGDAVIEVMTDKVTVELPAPFGGVLSKQMVKVGDIVPVHGVLALIQSGAQPGQAAPAPARSGEKPAEKAQAQAGLQDERSIIEGSAPKVSDPAKARAAFSGMQKGGGVQAVARPVAAQPAPAPPSPQPQTSQSAPSVRAVPSARRLARELGISIEEVMGSGPNGRVRSGDVQAHHSAPLSTATPAAPAAARAGGLDWPPPAPPLYRTPSSEDGRNYAARETRTPLRGVRRATSQGLLAATLHSAQTHTIEELDCTGLNALRAELKADSEVKLSYLPFILKAVSAALRLYPVINSSIDAASSEVVLKDFVNLGVAVNTDAGLMVPVIRSAETLGVQDFARQVTDLAERARSSGLKPAEMADATFTVSNIGSVGSMLGVPIVSPPQAAIMSVHSVSKRVVVIEENGQDVMAIRPMMYLTLSFDHRLVDGADAARFLKKVVWLLEKPQRLLLGS